MNFTQPRVVLPLSWFWVLVSCATSEPTAPSHVAPPAELATQAPRKLPKTVSIKRFEYPDLAWREGLTGRVLVEFRLDSRGKAISPKIVAADAARVLQEAALMVLGTITYDVSTPGFDAADPKPLLVTVRFCLPNCGDIPNFPGTEDISVRSSHPPNKPAY